MLDRLRNWLIIWCIWYTLKHGYPGTEIFVVIGVVIYLTAQLISWIGRRRARRQLQTPRRQLPRDLSRIG